MTEKTPPPYVILPRFISDMLMERELSHTQYLILVWLRHTADMMGITTTSLSSIREDLDLKISDDAVRKALQHLRSKRLIHYANRQGKGGSFRIRISHCFVGKHNYREYPEPEATTIEVSQPEMDTPTPIHTPSIPKLEQAIPNLEDERRKLAKAFSVPSSPSSIRSPYNDTDTERDIKTLASSTKGRTSTVNFHPRSEEQEAVRRIALAVGDPDINPLLWALKQYGLPVIEESWADLKRQKAAGTHIANQGAFLMAIIKSKGSKR